MEGPALPPPTLIGVGVGPGDPELVTVKAVKTLREADVVLVPSTDPDAPDAGRAEAIVLAACPEAATRLERIPFDMTPAATAPRLAAREASVRAALAAFDAGARTVAFATVGDPSVYSTFSYLAAGVRAGLPDVAVGVVPGITAMQALAAASRTPLVEGRETLTLVPVTAGLDAVGAALDGGGTVVAYKGGRQLAGVLSLVRAGGRDGVLGVDVGLPGEALTRLSDVDADRAPYFSTVLVAPRRDQGGRP